MSFATKRKLLYVFKYGFSKGILRVYNAVTAHETLLCYFMSKAKCS